LLEHRLPSRRADRIAYGLLLALWLSQVAANLIWLKVDTRPAYSDTAHHAIAAAYFSKLPITTDLPGAFRGLFTTGTYPPLIYWLSAPLGFLFWPSADTFTGINTLFLAVLLLSTYGLARTFGGRRVGLLAAFVVSMYPLVYGLERYYLLDVPLVAMVALSSWLLIRTESFERRNWTLVYGVSLGLGMLTKWTFAVFAVGPLAQVIVTAACARKPPSRHRWSNLACALALGAVVAAPWYLVNAHSGLRFLDRMSVPAHAESNAAATPLASWSYYLQAFVNIQVLLPFALFFALGLIVLLIKRGVSREVSFLLCWIPIPYLCFLILYKDPRYTMPYLPAVAIITAWGLTLLRPKTVRIGAIALLSAYAAFQFIGLSWGLSSRLPTGLLPGRVAVCVRSTCLPVYAEEVHIASPPRTENWPVQAILHDLPRPSQPIPKTEFLRLAVLPNAPCFEPAAFMYYALIEHLPIEILILTGISEASDARAKILTSDYVIAKTGDLGPAWSLRQIPLLSEELRDPASELSRQFALIATYSLPDGSTAMLYKRTPSPE
jgi:4-amino-4-deoxy-L-arabinose transferase-like glycosyltransferase